MAKEVFVKDKNVRIQEIQKDIFWLFMWLKLRILAHKRSVFKCQRDNHK